MSTKVIVIQNIKTENRYTVDEAGLKAIQDKGLMSRFTIIEERVVASGRTMIPAEIRERVKDSVDAAAKGSNTNKKAN